jgi:hypothetical protein
MIARILEKQFPGKRRDTRHCELNGCKKATTGRKPFCTDHLGQMPYVQGLQEEILRREDEWDRVLRRGAREVDPTGTTAHELIQYLKVHSERTIRRMAKDLSMDLELLTPYVNALRRLGWVRVTKNKRGIPLVHYLGDGNDSSNGRRKSDVLAA